MDQSHFNVGWFNSHTKSGCYIFCFLIGWGRDLGGEEESEDYREGWAGTAASGALEPGVGVQPVNAAVPIPQA